MAEEQCKKMHSCPVTSHRRKQNFVVGATESRQVRCAAANWLSRLGAKRFLIRGVWMRWKMSMMLGVTRTSMQNPRTSV